MKTFLIIGKNDNYDGVNPNYTEIVDPLEKNKLIDRMKIRGLSSNNIKIFDESQMIVKSPLFADAIKSIIDIYFPKTWNAKKSLYNYYPKAEVIIDNKITTYVHKWDNATISENQLDRIRYIYDDKDKEENQTVLIINNK